MATNNGGQAGGWGMRAVRMRDGGHGTMLTCPTGGRHVVRGGHAAALARMERLQREQAMAAAGDWAGMARLRAQRG